MLLGGALQTVFLTACDESAWRVLWLRLKQETPATGIAPEGCEFSVNITGDHEVLDVHERMPCRQTDDGYWVTEPDELDHVDLVYTIDPTARESVRARFKLAFEADVPAETDTGVYSGATPQTGIVVISQETTVTFENGATISLDWYDRYLH